LGFADIITIQVSRGLEQFFAKMRIADALLPPLKEPAIGTYLNSG